MRVLQIHNYYKQAGGEDAVVANEAKLLADHGHNVCLWSVDNATIEGVWPRLKAAYEVPYSRGARDRLAAVIATRNDLAVQDVPYAKLRPKLVERKQHLKLSELPRKTH